MQQFNKTLKSGLTVLDTVKQIRENNKRAMEKEFRETQQMINRTNEIVNFLAKRG